MTEKSPNLPLSLAQIHPEANIHESVEVAPFSCIYAGVEIDAGTYIGSNVSIHPGVKIGKNCYIAPGTVLTPDTERLEYWKDKVVFANAKHPRLIIGDNVKIGASSTLHGEIVIGKDTWIGSNVTILDGARIGNNCRIFPGAVLSAIPQDLKFQGERTLLEVGDNTVIRECATLNRGTNHSGKTIVGSDCLIMAYVHIAHDCVIGNHVVMANAVTLAGHVEVGDYAILGGVSAYHQFVKIGAYTMVSGGSKVRKDVPPFIKVGRDPVQYEGVNSIGLRRRGFEAQVINHLQEIYRHVFIAGKNNRDALAHIETHLPYSEERDIIVNFIRSSERGIVKGYTSRNA